MTCDLRDAHLSDDLREHGRAGAAHPPGVAVHHREVGADYFLIRFRHPGGPAHPQVLEALELFGREVIPRFR